MDEHFRSADITENLPAILGLIGVWYANFAGARTHAVLPYDQYLRLLARLPATGGHGEQRQARHPRRGRRWTTAPARWSGASPAPTASTPSTSSSTRAPRLIPADFIAAIHSHNPLGDHHAKLMANFFAQTEALMRGRTVDEALAEMQRRGHARERARFLARHRTFPGNRPTNSILMERLTPHTLGALIALYEHRIFTQGVVWGVNSYDQWGVELGKQLAGVILKELNAGQVTQEHDGSTTALLEHFMRHRR